MFLFCIATIQLLLGNYDAAIKLLKALAPNRNAYLVNYHLALCYSTRLPSDFGEALRYCELGLMQRPRFAGLFNLKAILLYKLERFDEIVAIRGQLNKRNELLFDLSTHGENYVAILDKLTKYIQLVESQTNADSVKQTILSAEFENLLYYKCIFLYLKAKDAEVPFVFEDMEDHVKYERIFLESTLEAPPLSNYKLSNYIYFIGCVLLNSKCDTDSIKYFERALQMDPGNGFFYKAKVYYLLKKCDYAKVVAFLTEAPGLGNIYYD